MKKDMKWTLKKSLILLLVAILFSLGMHRVTTLCQMQQQVAQKVLRFHVLANSNTDKDQQLKLKVRDQVGAYIAVLLQEAQSMEESRQILKDHLEEIEACAERAVEENGSSCPVTAQLSSTFFPEKTYGKVTFPPGEYEALRLTIGEGKGRNWWCVLYPNLCFGGSLYQVEEETGQERLAQVLSPEEYRLLMEEKNFQVSFWFLEKFRDMRQTW